MRMNMIVMMVLATVAFAGVALSVSAEEPEATQCELKVKVTGMSCPVGCAPRVQKALETQDGVANVTVSFEKGEALVSASGSACNVAQEERLMGALKKAGFEGQIVTRTSKGAAR